MAAASPEVLIAHLAERTSTIRVGAGTVLLNYAKPLRVAEAYRTLDALHPGRIDLGLGRAGAAAVVDASLDLSAPDPLGLPAGMPGGDQLHACCADTDAEADRLRASVEWFYAAGPPVRRT